MSKSEDDVGKKVIPYIRTVQAISIGVFTLGISMIVGDLAGYVELPVSVMSITTTLFGGMGAIFCEVMARWAKKW